MKNLSLFLVGIILLGSCQKTDNEVKVLNSNIDQLWEANLRKADYLSLEVENAGNSRSLRVYRRLISSR